MCLFIIVFVLLTQFMIKHLDRFLGKGLEISIILKFIFYHSLSILSLAAPMAILVATMMAFGRLSSDNEITGFKSAGISYYSFLKPGLFFGFIIVFLMIPFNLWFQPEIIHNTRKLSYMISKNRPDIEIKENMLNNIYEKIIYVGDRINRNSFGDIVIFDKENKKHYTTILADIGNFTSLEDGLLLDLLNGSIHEKTSADNKEYRRTYFDNYKILVPFDKINLDKNRVLIRQDREMNYQTLREKIDYKYSEINKMENSNIMNLNKVAKLQLVKDNLRSNLDSLLRLGGKSNEDYKNKFIKLNQTKTSINNLNNNIVKNNKIIPHLMHDINKYKVELHKMFSIPIACIVFIFLGIPLGIIAKKGSFSISIAVSIGFFILYWALLTIGQFLGDEGKLNAGIAMWLGNIFIGFISIYLFYLSSNENSKLRLDFLKIKKITQIK